MERVFWIPSKEISHIGAVGVVLTLSDPADGQLHIGIKYRQLHPPDERYLHLSWHYYFKDEKPPAEFLLADPDIAFETAEQVVARCRQVARANLRGLPYGFSHPTGAFEPGTGAFAEGPSRVGLTCATFVLAIFDDVGAPLIEYSTWPIRPEDAEWRDKIIASLAATQNPKYKPTPEHLAALRADTTAVRFRPHEVAAAAISPQLPTSASFNEVQTVSEELMQIVLKGHP